LIAITADLERVGRKNKTVIVEANEGIFINNRCNRWRSLICVLTLVRRRPSIAMSFSEHGCSHRRDGIVIIELSGIWFGVVVLDPTSPL
jgi:hypothetical protein